MKYIQCKSSLEVVNEDKITHICVANSTENSTVIVMNQGGELIVLVYDNEEITDSDIEWALQYLENKGLK